MKYLTAELIVYYITITANIFYAALFIYHAYKKDTNKSLMIVSGCLCLSMAFLHSFSSFINSLDKTSSTYSEVIVNVYLIWITLSSSVILSIYTLLLTAEHFRLKMANITLRKKGIARIPVIPFLSLSAPQNGS
jgi:hypothetical protein